MFRGHQTTKSVAERLQQRRACRRNSRITHRLIPIAVVVHVLRLVRHVQLVVYDFQHLFQNLGFVGCCRTTAARAKQRAKHPSHDKAKHHRQTNQGNQPTLFVARRLLHLDVVAVPIVKLLGVLPSVLLMLLSVLLLYAVVFLVKKIFIVHIITSKI